MNNKNDQSVRKILFNWQQATALPDMDGFAGSYAGVSNGALLVAGGSNFPGNSRPWSGGVKAWYDKIFVLDNPTTKWLEAGKLPRKMGYGVSLTYDNGILCLGGGDANACYVDAFILKNYSGKVVIETLPSMPFPLMNASGLIAEEMVFIAGGISSPNGLTQKYFWGLDLSAPSSERKWQIIGELPGKSRMFSIVGTDNDNFFLFGGVHLTNSSDGSGMNREYLKDSWLFNRNTGWKRIADMPGPLAAAPSPAYMANMSLIIFGGDDGRNAIKVSELMDRHPGFRNEILCYDIISDLWNIVGTMPVDLKKDAVSNPGNSIYSPVTTPLVIWNNAILIPGGEARPAVRSNKMLLGVIQK